MECAEIRSYLSEYLDGALDAQTVTLVEKHLLKCTECKKAFESLQSLVLQLGDLDHIKAPHDFLEQLHARMAKRLSLRELVKRLFVPFKIKIPLQFATAVAMAILIFSVIHTPEIEKEMDGIPTPERISENLKESETKDYLRAKQKKEAPVPAAEIIQPLAPHSEEQLGGLPGEAAPVNIESSGKITTAKPLSQEKAHLRETADEKAEHEPSVKGAAKPIELVLLLKSEISTHDATSQVDREQKVFLSSGKGETGDFSDSDVWKAARTTKKDGTGEDRAIRYLAEEELRPKEESVLEVISPDEVLSKIKDLINNVKGTVLSAEYDQNTSQPKTLSAEIPAGQYGFFCEKLQQLGTFQSPMPDIDITGLERIKILIRFTHS